MVAAGVLTEASGGQCWDVVPLGRTPYCWWKSSSAFLCLTFDIYGYCWQEEIDCCVL